MTDENDEPPVFVVDLSQVIQLSSTHSVGEEILKLKAMDGDEWVANSTKIRYSIEENEYLEVEPETGAVLIKKTFPPNLELRLRVTAKEEGENGMETVDELRVRSHLPEPAEKQVSGDLCDGKVYTARIKEGKSSFEDPLVIRLSTPADPSTFRIEGGYSAFGIDLAKSTNTSIHIVAIESYLIDYEKRKSFEIYVSSSLGRCRVNVEVLDVNDNSPKCVHDSFTFYVTENHKPTILGEVKAVDPDSDLYSPITYVILGTGAKMFAISEEGEFRSVVPIDREEHDKFDLIVRATDAGGNGQTAREKSL